MSVSRLIVKNLPDSATDDKLKKLFESKGTVTDVQLKRFEDGKFRRFAFIGFKTPEEAQTAKEYFDKTFFGAAKIQVDFCHSLNDPHKPKPWGKLSKAKAAEEKEELKKKKKKKLKDEDDDDDESSIPKKVKKKEEEIFEKAKNDPEFLEFLEVHSKKKAKWGNDTVLDTLEKLVQKKKSKKGDKEDDQVSHEEIEHDDGDEEELTVADKEKNKAKKNKKVRDNLEVGEEEMCKPKLGSSGKLSKKESLLKPKESPPIDTYFYVKIRNLTKSTKKGDLKKFFRPLVSKSVRIPPNYRGFAYIGFRTEQERMKALQKNRSILLGNQVFIKTYISRAAAAGDNSDKQSRWKGKEEELAKQAEGVEESGRIYARNLSYTVEENELKMEFEKFGPVTEVHLPIDRISRQNKGFAFITFMLPEHAVKAFDALDGTVFQGRMLHLIPAKPKEEVDADKLGAGSSYKNQRELKLRKTAGSSHNWNALFLGQNAVTSVTAQKYGVSREEILLDNNDQKDDRGSSVAVRMALAETEIVAETKKFLEANGVSLDAFNYENVKVERSSTVILVKNLVAKTSENEVREIFEKFGVIGRVVIPPFGITAIVEFMAPAEARAAFKKLAYSKFKDMPLFLEWAPTGVFRVAVDGSRVPIISRIVHEEKPTEDKAIKIQSLDEIKLPTYKEEEPLEENMVPEPESTLFIKNLNFSTTEEDIKKHFSDLGHIYAVSVARKKDPKNPGNMLSQGFGFIQFYRSKTAAAVLMQMNQSMLSNHLLELKMSSRTLISENEVKNIGATKGTKILVRNVPFQASEAEVTDLFKVFGKLKAIRMPKKNMGESQHRGFAFVEFFTEANAKTAFDTLSKSTHLYGRRLVLEWAQKDASVEELREKVAKHYGSLQEDPSGVAKSSDKSTKKGLKRYFDSAQSSKKNADNDSNSEDED